MQNGVKLHSDKGKDSTMKEMWNLVIKNQYFNEMLHELMTQE